jgi:hypothetical protein
MARKRKPTDIIQVNLRITEEMRRDVLARAKKSGSSFNGELLDLIARGMEKPDLADRIVSGVVEQIVVRRQEMREELRNELETLALYLNRQAPANQQAESAPPPEDLAQVHRHLHEALALLGFSRDEAGRYQRPQLTGDVAAAGRGGRAGSIDEDSKEQ